MNKLIIGGDFEGFVRLNSGWIPAERVLGGSKEAAIGIGKGIVAHPDNVMAEFALQAPVPVEEFASRVREGMHILGEHISPATFVPASSLKFTQEWLNTSKMSGQVGCMPDLDTTGREYQYDPETLGLYRFAGFHLHFDVNPMLPKDYAVQLIDCTIGLASIANEWDHHQGRRRQYYGTAGRYRDKPYGVEYRTLSSGMLNHVEGLQEYLEPVAYALLRAEGPLLALPQMMWDAASQAINSEDVGMAKALLKEVKLQ